MPGEGGAQVASPLAMLMPYLQMGLSWMLDSAVSGKSDLLKFSNMDPSRSVAANFQNAYESNLQKRMFGYAMQRQSEEQSRRIVEAGYRVLGYDQPSAYYESKKTGAGIVGWAVDTFLGDQWNEGLSTMYGSAFGRRAFDSSGRYRMRNDYQQLGDELLKMHYEQGAFGNASFSEVGGVAAALINSGRYDDFGRGMRSTVNSKNQFVDENGNVLQEGDARLTELQEKDPYGTGYWQRNANGPATLIRRADVISKDVKEYTRALTNLQDVIGGDMTQIMDTLDKLFGTSATAISADRLNNLTNSLRQSMHATGASLQQMATLGATAFSYIAPFGGTENNANRVAVDTSFVTEAGVVEEGTNKDRIGAETVKIMSNNLISGETGNIAVAYNFWAKQKNLDVHKQETYEQFKKETAGRKWKEADMLAFMHEVAPNASNEVFEAAMRDTDAAKLADEFNIGMKVLVEQSQGIEKEQRSNLTELTQKINKMTGENMTVEELFGEDWATTSTAKVRERAGKILRDKGHIDASIIAESEVIGALQNPAASRLGVEDGATARNIQINAMKAEKAQEQATYQTLIQDFFGSTAADLANTGTEGGLGGVFQAMRMRATNDEQKTEITDLFFGAVGLTKEQVEAYNKGEINSAEDIDELLDKNAGTIAETYKRVFGKEYTGKDKQGAAKELLKKFSESKAVIAPFMGGTMKQGAKLQGNTSYAGLEANAVNAALVLDREDATKEEKDKAREAIRAYSAVTEGMELYEVAAETDQLDKLGTEEGKKELQKIIDTRQKSEDYVNRVVRKNTPNADREAVKDRLSKLQEATSGLSDSQRKTLADSLKLIDIKNNEGKVIGTRYGFDDDAVKRLKASGLTDEQIQQIGAGADLLATAEKRATEDLDANTLLQATKDAITLPNSNDPIQVLGSSFQDLLQQILQAIKDIFGAIPQQQQ